MTFKQNVNPNLKQNIIITITSSACRGIRRASLIVVGRLHAITRHRPVYTSTSMLSALRPFCDHLLV
jgi:hypothetical protein